jgi:hypothetical protein
MAGTTDTVSDRWLTGLLRTGENIRQDKWDVRTLPRRKLSRRGLDLYNVQRRHVFHPGRDFLHTLPSR